MGLFTNLGFTIHPVKSVLQPQQQIDFLGFALGSITMTVTLTDAKVMKVKLDIDLFASRLNFKAHQYVSWRPDPGAQFINAFLMNWKPYNFYAFPPFSLLATCLQKREQDQSTGILIVPMWTTQPWFTLLLDLLTDNPLALPQTDSLLFLAHSNAIHPLNRRLQLMACKVLGCPSRRETFQAKQPTSPCSLGQLVPKTMCPVYQEMA